MPKYILHFHPEPDPDRVRKYQLKITNEAIKNFGDELQKLATSLDKFATIAANTKLLKPPQ